MEIMLPNPLPGQMILVVEALTETASLSMRSAPLSPVLAVLLASRMATSPTPAKIQPATPDRLDHYPEMPSTPALMAFLLDKPANMVYRYGFPPGNN